MARNVIIAGVGTSQIYDTQGNHILTSRTLVNSGISFTSTIEEIRGGGTNQLLGQFVHDTGLALTLEDALFNLNHIALNIGSTIQIGGDIVTTEQVTTTDGTTVTVSETPQDFLGFGTVGYYKLADEDDSAWTKFDLDATTKTGTISASANDVICVRYATENASAEKLVISANFVPSIASVILTLPMYKAGTDATTTYSSATKIGEIVVKIPQFQFDGAEELSLTSSGASTSSLSGKALAQYTSGECDADGTYGEIISVEFNKDEFDDVKAIVVLNGDMELSASETATIQVQAVYGGAVAPKTIDNSKLTFTATGSSATVSTAGVVTADASTTGVTTIEVAVTSKPTLTSALVVTVE